MTADHKKSTGKHSSMAKGKAKNQKTSADDGEEEKVHKYLLDELDRKIIKLIMDFPEMKRIDLAKEVGLSEGHLYKRIGRPSFKKFLADLLADTGEIMAKNATLASRKLAALINHADPNIALQAVRMALHPFLNTARLEFKNTQEIVYIAQFGGDGQIISDRKEIHAQTAPKNTLELLTGKDVIDVEPT